MRAIIDGVEKTSRSPLPICAAVLTPCAQVVIASPLIPCLFHVRTSHCAQGPAEAAMPSRSRTRTGLARSMRTKMDPGDREQGRHGLPVRQRHTPWSMLGSCAEVPRPSRAAPRPRLCPGCAASLSLIPPSLFFAAMSKKKIDRLKEGQDPDPWAKQPDTASSNANLHQGWPCGPGAAVVSRGPGFWHAIAHVPTPACPQDS